MDITTMKNYMSDVTQLVPIGDVTKEIFEYANYKDDAAYQHIQHLILCMNTDAANTQFLYDSISPDANTSSLCNTTFNGITCWPTTTQGNVAVVPCPDEYDGIKINPEGFATKYCYPNGTWEEWANYSQCTPHHKHYIQQDEVTHQLAVRIMYYVGFSLSTAALLAALVIFLSFRSLRCLRNNIHCHLIVTFILKNIMWILLDQILPILITAESGTSTQIACRALVASYNYLQATNFYWMLVEGLYLFSIIVWAYSTNKIRIWHFIIVGWGTPVLVILTWCIVKATKDNEECWLSAGTSNYDYIYIAPNLLALGINTLILGVIVWVLLSKLRASYSSGVAKKFKAARGTIILVPLLGVTYVLFITPFWNHNIAQRVFVYANAILQSHQGFAVAVLYCFLNKEVQNTIKKKFSRWQDERSVATRYTRASVVSASHDAFNEFRKRRRSSAALVSNGGNVNGTVMRRYSETSSSEHPLVDVSAKSTSLSNSYMQSSKIGSNYEESVVDNNELIINGSVQKRLNENNNVTLTPIVESPYAQHHRMEIDLDRQCLLSNGALSNVGLDYSEETAT